MATLAAAIVAILALVLRIEASESPRCPEGFFKQLSTVRDWSTLHSIYKKCPDDGAYGEGLSNTVVATLAHHWDDLPALDSLFGRDTSFRRVVLRHIDATTDEKDLRRVLSNAQTKCPAGYGKVCRDIEAAAKAAIADL